jgi:hemolysin activation/secretion protein
MNTQILKATIIILTSDFLIAGSCSNGFCGVTVPHIPTDIQNNTQLKPFNAANKQTNKGYSAWGLVDNGGDDTTGENRFMLGADINSLFGTDDKLSLFGLITSENVTSGKLSYAYTLPWNNIIVEASYINTNYTLNEPIPGATGIGTANSIGGKITYPFINTKEEKLNFSLSFNNNNISEEIDNTFNIINNDKKSYSGTALLDFKTKNNTLSLGVTTGDLSFDNIFNEQIDKLGANVQGSYTKINLDYKNISSLSENISLESNFRSQYAFNDKNLDDSETISIGGMNGVKLYEEGSVYDSNGFLANIEGKYKLPEMMGVKNTIGVFYDFGQIWESDNLTNTNETITVQDAGVGIYTNYKMFFSKIQAAFEVGNSEVSAKDDKNYRVLFQTGLVF